MKTFLGIVFLLGILLIAGLAEGVAAGRPIANLLWCIPILLIITVIGLIIEQL